MKIFAAGLATETNTFSPLPTSLEDFAIQRGSDVLAGSVDYPSLNLHEVWGRQAEQRGDTFVFSLNAWAQPSGTIVRSAYETLRGEILDDLHRAVPVDIVLLMLHGAMLAEGYDSCEEDIIRRVRQIVGPDVVIAVELDLHCHLRESLLSAADLIVTFKEYPHVDMNDRAQELFQLAIDAKLGRVRPVMALFDCRMIGMYPTSREPLRGFVDSMLETERNQRLLSVSFAHGFQFADVPHVGAKVLAITNGDRELAEHLARDFGRRVHALRRQIGFDAIALPLEEAFAKALAIKREGGPVVIADQSDNVGGGAPGDATFALRWLLDRSVDDAAVAIFYDPEVVRIAKKAGSEAKLTVRLGGKLGRASGDPLDIDVTVRSVIDGYMHEFPQQRGPAMSYPLGSVVALRCGSIDIVVASERCQCYGPSVFADLGIEPSSKRLLVVKSAQHFYGAFAPIASEVIYMAAPGAVSPDPRRIAYANVDTSRLYPWVEHPLEV